MPQIVYHPIHILAVWAEARAILWRAGEIEGIGEALDPLVDFIHRNDIDVTVAAAVLRDAFPGFEIRFGDGEGTDSQDGDATIL